MFTPMLLMAAALAAPEPTPATDLVELHLAAGTPGVRLVCKPPPEAGPDAEPYVIELRIPPWEQTAPALSVEPVDAAPAGLLSSSVSYAGTVPDTAAYATQPLEVEALPPEPEAAFLRHTPVEEPEPEPEPEPVVEPEPEPVEPSVELAAAAANFEKACEGGYAQGCTALARMVDAGTLGEPDPERARALYERGCEQGDAKACQSGQVEQPAAEEEPAPAVAAAEQPEQISVERSLFDSCRDGDNAACNDLGERHTHGDGVARDYEQAAKLFRRACAGGDMAACTNLGILYKVGEGVAQDEGRADRLLMLACNGGAGDERACGGVAE